MPVGTELCSGSCGAHAAPAVQRQGECWSLSPIAEQSQHGPQGMHGAHAGWIHRRDI